MEEILLHVLHSFLILRNLLLDVFNLVNLVVARTRHHRLLNLLHLNPLDILRVLAVRNRIVTFLVLLIFTHQILQEAIGVVALFMNGSATSLSIFPSIISALTTSSVLILDAMLVRALHLIHYVKLLMILATRRVLS